MDLPQELLDEIFSHLPSDGVELLRGCSLVSKSWLEPSRRILFAEISIPSDKYQSWLDCISPENTAILRHVRSLKFFPSNTMAPDSSYGVYTLRNYFPSLCQLQSLSLHNIDVEPTISRDPDLFSPFQHTLSSLSLVTVSITWSALVALLRCFPLLRNLEIHEILFLVDNEQSISPLPNTLRGRLVLGPLQGVRPFVDHFPDMKQEYEELVLFGVPEPCIVAAVQENLKYLTIHRCELGATADLSRCSKLRKVEIVTIDPREREQTLISSITSTVLQKLIFTESYSFSLWLFLHNPFWIQFDGMICELVDRLRASGLKHTLELEFRVGFVWFGLEEHHEIFLPKFKEKGRVRMVSLASDRIQEWP